ncbi:MAG: translation initiation factor IF-5A [Candidatus Wukongarchaeota archaeon]|nr:translation initiation factor IF-5A [Candidatus Wukongarchaeota archaeon]
MGVRVDELGKLKVGSYVLIDGEPCKVLSTDKSKPGKHGAAKVRLSALGLFDNSKRQLLGSVTTRVEVPIIEKFEAQVVSVLGDTVQLMDLASGDYAVFDVEMPKDPELVEKIVEGVNVEVWRVLERDTIMRVK